MKQVWCAGGLLLGAASALFAGEAQLSPYRVKQKVSGKLVAWGNENNQETWRCWTEGFANFQPGVRFEGVLKSTATAAGALYTGVANVGIFGREIWPLELLGFKRFFGYDAFSVTVGTGSYDVPNKTFALGVFVHKDNPITRLTLAQLEALFGDLGEGASGIRRWGDLGLTGEWADKPVHLYGYPVDLNGFSYFFAQTVFRHTSKWSCKLRDLDQIDEPGGKVITGGERITGAVAKDRYGIGYTGFCYKNPGVKTLALAKQESGPFIEGTPEAVASREYPLTRSIFIFVNRNPVSGIDPTVKEFLRYVLSREGQEAVARDGFLRLTPAEAREQRRRVAQ